MKDKITAVQELVDACSWITTEVNEENYLRLFWSVLDNMISELWHDKTKQDKVANDRFAQYLHFEFLPQYAIMLWYNLHAYQEDVKQRIDWNLYL